ncbi:MAG: TonB-dependent receptor [Cyclobacteriaceae bacterium]
MSKNYPLSFLLLLFLLPGIVKAQSRTVTGTVTYSDDASGIPGVNVLVKGTSTGVVTDFNGSYTIQVPSDNSTLVFSFIGFTTQEILVGTNTQIDVKLSEDVQQLSEIVVTGYGEQERKTLTSSISSIDKSAIENLPSPSPDVLMQGRASGVLVTSNSGTPGGGISVRVRGSTSVNAGNDPLYVIDGIPMQSTVIANTGDLANEGVGGQLSNPMADINPADIESIEVLKDASATAIYGARAANGVVLITTKRGNNKGTKINVGSYYGVQNVWKKPDLVDGPTFEMLRNEAAVNNGGSPIYADPASATNTNYADQIFREAAISNFDISVTGGDNKLQYMISGSKFNQEGIIAPSEFDRATGRLNLDAFVTDKLKIGTSILYSKNTRNRVNNDDNISGALGGTFFFPPNLPAYQPDGSYTKFSIFENPLAVINENNISMKTNRVLANVYAEYEFFPGLSLRSTYSQDYSSTREDIYINTKLNSGAAVNGSAVSAVTTSENWIQENVLNYQKRFGSNHNLGVLVGTTLQESVVEKTRASGTGFPSDDFTRIASAAVQQSSSIGSSWGIASLFTRINYGYKDKYLFTVNMRRDASSRFGKSNQWGTFPSIALGWVVTEESFMDDINALSSLKLRVSYGVTGNQNGINDFQSRGLWTGGANYTSTPGTEASQLGNPDLKWERTGQFDVGFDMALFQNKVNITFDYYDKKTTDMLLEVPVPRTSGFTDLFQNFGEMRNKGIELSISGDIIKQANFSWNAMFNVAQNKNEIVKLAQPIPVYNRDIIRLEEGIPLYSFWMHEQLGVNTEDGSPIWRQVDDSRPFDPNIDRFIVGNAWPDFFGGLTNNLKYKNIDMMVFFQYSLGNDQLYWSRFFQEHGGTRNTGFLASQLDRWQQPGDVTMVPKMNNANYAANLRPSRLVEDGSYVRLKNVTIGYTFPSSLVSKIGLSNARIYMSGQNLLTFTNYSGMDPEVNATASTALTQGVDFYTMPQPRVIMGGVNLTF